MRMLTLNKVIITAAKTEQLEH